MTVLYPMVIDFYFKRAKFLTIKAKVTSHIEDCNELNDHIEHLKLSYVDIESFDYGTAQLVDTSLYNMNRPQWVSDSRDRRTHLCSSSVATSASNQPYKYLCKYFNVEPSEETLEKFEQVLNDFSAVEQGKHLLAKERDEIIASVSSSISTFMMKHHLDRVTKELGFHKISLSNVYFPVYTFKYVSAAGKSGFETPIKLDIKGLEGFIKYLANLIKFKNSIAGQRALMTVKLREKIKRRDNYSCQFCTLSTSDEANLLLEIDHIIPLSKGGITAEENLQTLCWKCNRTKGSKIYNNEAIPHSVLTSPEKSDTAWPPRANTPASPEKSDTAWPPRANTPASPEKSDTAWPPRANTSASPTKLDMTRPPRANTSASPTKLDMTRPPRANTSASPTKLDMTRPPRANTSASPTKLDMTRPPRANTSASDSQRATTDENVVRTTAKKQSTSLTRSQTNALRSAKDHLEYSGYSRIGLIEELREIDRYSVSDATAAVDSLNIDWKEQAVKSAKDHLEYSGYSRIGLIEELREIDRYSVSDATAAVDSLNIDWKEQAVKSAKDYLEYSGYSRIGLIEELREIDRYTVDQATYGVDKVGLYS